MIKKIFNLKTLLFSVSLLLIGLSITYVVRYYSNDDFTITNNMSFGRYEYNVSQPLIPEMMAHYDELKLAFELDRPEEEALFTSSPEPTAVRNLLLEIDTSGIIDDIRNISDYRVSYNGQTLFDLPKGGTFQYALNCYSEEDQASYTLYNLKTGDTYTFDSDQVLSSPMELTPGIYAVVENEGIFTNGYTYFKFHVEVNS